MNDLKSIISRCGDWDLKNDKEWYTHQDRQVKSITIHPRFFEDQDYFSNDIALIHVEKDFDLADKQAEEYLNVAPICLPAFEDVDFQEDKCVSMSWGGVPEYHVSMQQVNFSIVENKKCEGTLRRKTRLENSFSLPSNLMCARGEHKKNCGKEVGAPLVCQSKNYPNR